MRYVLALAILIAGGMGGFLVYHHLTAGPAIVLPAPRSVAVAQNDQPLSPGGWAATSRVDIKVRDTRVTAGVDAEVQVAGKPFTNAPTTTLALAPGKETACTKCPSGTDSTIPLHLPDGAYHIQVRLHNNDGISPWMAYRGALRIDTEQPRIESVTSPTAPDTTKTYHSSTVRFAWLPADRESGVAGISYRLDTDPHGTARAEVRTNDNAVTLTGLNSGTFYFHVRAIDRAGNWGQSATFPVHIDVTPPGLAHVRFNLFQLDPQFDNLRVSFGVTKAAPQVRIGIYRQSDGAAVRDYDLRNLAPGQAMNVAWDGKDAHGQYAPGGTYEIYIRARDQYGHSSLTGWRDFVLDYRRIKVSLSQQRLWAYDGSKLFLTSLVTTGNQALPTPLGVYHILARLHPFTFHSPWPKSSPYYYKPSKTEYAMLFQDQGYFIHDAPWRTAFGPGTNSQLGTPGSNYTGTHGCINVPSDVARSLFGFVQLGTVVQVVP